MDLKEIYTQMILEQSRNKKNRRNLDDPTYKELGHNPSCGDEITLEVKVEDGFIKDMSYTGVGCAISQASTSIMIDTLKGKKIEDAIRLSEDFINMVKGEEISEESFDELGDSVAFENIKTMPARVKCAVLAWYTLKNLLEKED